MNRVYIVLVFIGLVIFACIGGWCGWKIRELAKANDLLNEQLMGASLELGKAKTQFGDAQKYASELEEKLRKAIKERDEMITEYGKLLAAYNAVGSGSSNAPNPPNNSEVIVVTPVLTPGNIYVAQTADKAQEFVPPIPFRISDNRLTIDVALNTSPVNEFQHFLSANISYNLQLKIMAQLVETITESGAVSKYANIYEINEKGEKIGKFDIIAFEVVVEDHRKAKLHLWNPKLDLGILAGYNSGTMFGGGIGISLASYGVTESDLIWRFARFGAFVAGNNVGFDFSPVIWNLGIVLPVVSNLWIAPNVTFELNDMTFGLGMVFNIMM